MRYILFIIASLLLGISSYCSFYGVSSIYPNSSIETMVVDYQLEKEVEKDTLEQNQKPIAVDILSVNNPYCVPINFIGKKRNKDDLISL